MPTTASSGGVGIGPAIAPVPYAYGPPECEYGYYSYYPYDCAPYGYYGAGWFNDGLFLGVGPWYGFGWGRGYGWGRGWGWGGWGWGGGWGGPGFGTGIATTTTTDHETSNLVIDIFEGGSKKLLWRGLATENLSSNDDKNTKMVDGDINNMFKNFPPKVGK